MTKTATAASRGRSTHSAIVFTAACVGTQRLSEAAGVPVTFVGVTQDIEASLRRLNETRYGSGVRWPASFQPIDIEEGWSDWRQFSMEPEGQLREATPYGAHFEDGHVVVPLPAGTTPAEFEEHLSAAMRHMRVQEVVMSPAYLEARSSALACYDIHPRYTPGRNRDGFVFRGSRLCTDLIVFDPAEDAWRMLWIAVAALLGACEGRPLWK
jgi:hypothetical protein